MFIFLSKFLPLFIYPVGLVCVLILLALLFWKRTRFAKFALIVAFLTLFIGGNRYLANTLARSLEWQYPPLPDDVELDAIVVLGGSTEPALEPRQATEINAAGDRVIYAAMRSREFPNAKILLSGGDIQFLDQGSTTPASDMADLLKMMDVTESAMILQDRSQNTYEDALFSCEILKAEGFQNVGLVTSAMHIPRSVALFEKQGCKVIAAPTDYSITTAAWQKTWRPSPGEFVINLVPSYSNLSQVTKCMKEYLGMFVYRLRGWL